MSIITELFLGSDDLKKLHEFEGRCVAGYFFEKNENLHSSQINRICFTADKLVAVYLPNAYVETVASG